MNETPLSAKAFIQNNLRRAMQTDQLRLYYQPQFSVAEQQLTGVEALLRWNSKRFGWLSPEAIVAVAEQSDLIVHLSEWTLRQALQDFSRLQPFVKRLSVNLSVSYLQQVPVVAVVQQYLAESGIAPQCLDLEITETVVLESSPPLLSALQQLRQMGISLSIDDFGTGYCGLSYLKKLPLSTVKIDRSFLHDALNNARYALLYHDILQLARNLDLRIIAEGVETQAQLKFLKLSHCHEAQGYLLAKPMPLAQLQSFTKAMHPQEFLAVAEDIHFLLP
ncbi:hypothetical protein CWE13_09415 [Aliidiomarina shirensis]|uniref:EAL domain-containing protein n=1 Tax=Aliidiomarina shirensis TaxID=1048642 RepID=A0A432WQL1_9GAMM|nr:EAL domain-containing protein [Aliidiomarina shirensis]RUO36086.1 hypothetical protein CWE13_09415 [Aliidiomarina shirensis]